jgi:hypothetical protein
VVLRLQAFDLPLTQLGCRKALVQVLVLQALALDQLRDGTGLARTIGLRQGRPGADQQRSNK